MKKILIFAASIFFLSPGSVLAATSTPSASPTTTSSTVSATPSETEDIQQKIKTLVKENITATESSLQEKINQHILVGYTGKIQSINSGNISLIEKENNILQITTDEKTDFIKEGSAIKLSSMALSDKIIVIGTLLKDDIVLAKRIVVIKTDDEDVMTSDTVVAKISAIDPKKKTVSLIIKNEETIYTLTKKSTIKLTDLSEGQTIFAITKKFQGKDYLSRAKVIN